jgi:signal peptidase
MKRPSHPGRILAALALLTVLATGAIIWQQGYRIYVVHTGSMTPTYRPGDLVVDAPPGHLAPGEVITFRHSASATDVVTHRITEITPAGLIHTKGDANRTADVWDIRPDQVQGQVHFSLHGLGYVAVFLQQPAGIASIATTILAIVMLWGLFFPSGPESDPAPEPANRPRPRANGPARHRVRTVT